MTLPNYLPVGTRSTGTENVVTLKIGTGGIVDGASGVGGRTHYTQTLVMPVTATANTDFVMSVPTGCLITSMQVTTTVAYTAGTDCKIQVGNVAAGAQYVAATSVAAAAMAVPLTLLVAQVAALVSMPAPPNLFIRLVQTGTATAVGSAILIVNYVV